ncbi:hypothetical protein K490DRAFT_63936 [Saccharata proteae CBS 121410]|uniref:Uncharacterized protein n=1 Tax=Saccharata proteae CBS 121410 TaxID=1314787 RepID=A0A6A5YA58_9PEZI|nr:hypothetical protein K490DRAFT_63936 [Saccharata proteae CBS 121410]
MFPSLTSIVRLACVVASVTPLIAASEHRSSTDSQEPLSVFVLGPSSSVQTSALNRALHRLGYASQAAPDQPTFTNIDSADFSNLRWSSDYALVADRVQNAKFILPTSQREDTVTANANTANTKKRSTTGSPPQSVQMSQLRLLEIEAYQNYTRSVHDFFSQSDREGQLLELSIDAPEPDMVLGDKWVRLCEFLGLGYSIVERLKLKDFPLV